MFQLRRILLSGLVALLMVGMVTAGELNVSPEEQVVERSHIGTWEGNSCADSMKWQCLHIDWRFIFDIPF